MHMCECWYQGIQIRAWSWSPGAVVAAPGAVVAGGCEPYLMDVGNQTHFLFKSVYPLNHWAISPVLPSYFFSVATGKLKAICDFYIPI